jgi:hypothetical protein
MDNEEITDSFELTIRIDQLTDNRISWRVIPDDVLKTVEKAGLIELAGSGAPLAAIALAVLWHNLSAGLVNSSVELADAVQNEMMLKLAEQVESDMSADQGSEMLSGFIVH